MRNLAWLILLASFFTGCGSRETVLEKKQAGNFIEEATVLLKKGNVIEAVKIFQKEIVRNPQDTQAPFILAQLLMQLGNYPVAVAYFKRVIELEPDNGRAYLLLGGCYDLQGEKDEAILNVQKSVQIFNQQRDEQNFKQSVVILHSLVESKNKPVMN